MKIVLYLVLFLALLGILDTAYLSFEHFTNAIPPCHASFSFVDCGVVLRSKYAVVLGIPLAVLGLGYYLTLFVVTWLLIVKKRQGLVRALRVLVTASFLISGYLFYLQAAVIKEFCIYCLTSGVISLVVFLLVWIGWFGSSGDHKVMV